MYNFNLNVVIKLTQVSTIDGQIAKHKLWLWNIAEDTAICWKSY